MEVEIAPGIYLTKRPAEAAEDRKRQLHEQAVAALKANPHDYYEYLNQEIATVTRQIELLKYSNQEMQQHSQEDPVFEDAIKENIQILGRNEKRKLDLGQELKILGAQLGIAAEPEVGRAEKVSDQQQTEGVFL